MASYGLQVNSELPVTSLNGMAHRAITAVPKLWTAFQHMKSPSLSSPSLALRISINTGPNAFYGEKYKVEKVRRYLLLAKY